MLVVLFIVFLAIGITCYTWNYKSNCDADDGIWWLRGTPGTIAFCAALAMFIAIMVMLPKIATAHTYDTKIAIVEETNAQLEEQICASVDSYLKHENDTIKGMYGDVTDATTAIGIYFVVPELKGNEVVSRLIDTYQANAEEIKQLKTEKTNLALYKFLVYFGR